MAFRGNLHPLISQPEIDAAISRLAAEITREYQDKNPVILGILKGSFIFLADLVRHLDFPLEVEFIRFSSYGSARETSGRARLVQGLRLPVKGRHVLVAEDIVDTGITTTFCLEYVRKKAPASLRLCTLTDKPSRRQVPVDIDYLGITVPDKFLVGYGLDCDEQFRQLPEIYYLEDAC